MNNFTTWWDLCQIYDGSASDGPGTRWGWTYPTWCDARRYAKETDISEAAFVGMNQTQAEMLAMSFYWNRLRAIDIAAGSDVSFIDWCWTSGGAIMEVQTHLGLDVDGIVGPNTVAGINYDKSFSQNCHDWRVSYYNALGFQTKYPGLYTRASTILSAALKLAGGPSV